MKRDPSSFPRAQRPAMESTPILFRPTWAEAYASRLRHAANARPRHAAPSHPEATTKDLNDSIVPFNFAASGLDASATTAARDASSQLHSDKITCPDEAIRRAAAVQIFIIRETGAAMRAQANISARAARHLYH